MPEPERQHRPFPDEKSHRPFAIDDYTEFVMEMGSN